ncbi:hypothetical protein [Aulosira sp. FACHB-615]|uniref:hypothetical protein n=1 Tax=Aulosira sp. FACHB-615 TaxID=2692777 RepID=UPI001F558FF2|nr:hypothetical protein [Aulosira sp. FACHB-615]
MPHTTPAQQPPVRCALPHLKRIAAPDEQAIAQEELNGYVAEPAEEIAPEELRVVDISFFDKEYYAGDKLIATVTHDDDDFVTQRWVVMVNNAEEFRAATPMMCDRYIRIHYKDGSLPVQEQTVTDKPCTTGNEIMVQIATECDKYGLELLDDGVYKDDKKLGEVGFTDGHWWFIRAVSEGQKVACDSVDEAMQMLLVAEVLDWDELLNRPFDQLSQQEWRLLMEFEPVRELVAA